jgi:hypothetical protein
MNYFTCRVGLALFGDFYCYCHVDLICQEHVEELSMTNALLNERKEQLEERLNNKDRELTELKVPKYFRSCKPLLPCPLFHL